jgi:hypothetical protein
LVPAASVSITVSPTSASLSSGKSTTITPTVTGTTNSAVVWSMTPSLGTLSNGVYTAPSPISLQQTVTIAAASAADPTKVAKAVITLVPTVAVAVAPTATTLSAGQSVQLNASLSGTSNPNVNWSLSPAVGSLSNGLYQAPATISSQQVVTVTVASAADPTKTASATITLSPTAVGLAISPSSTSLTGGQSTQFTVTNSGTPTTAVTWTLAPSVGTITNGVYSAPVTISSLQTIVLTVASTTNPTLTAKATITLNSSTTPTINVNPSQATLNPSGTQQFTAAGLGTNPKWTISPATAGSITAAGLYKAPSTVTTQSTVTVTATNATDSTKAASASVTIKPAGSQTPPPDPTSITLPLELIGPDGTTVSTSFNIPSGTNLSGLQLWLKIHGLRYQTQASMQINGSAWVQINDTTVTILGRGAAYGGIGGGYHTLQLTMPANSLQIGANTLTFKFNGTDGTVSGFRVLAFNILSGGNKLLPQSTFTAVDPNTWTPPSTLASDIAAGQDLWRSASITVPSDSGATPIKAHCMDCHSQDGRDLKYFNYSNNSIRTRSMFHGLTAAQGDQIASYIRSLNVPNPGRPWNPPYQPGPGLDSQPVANWSAGAGIDAVLDTDAELMDAFMPGGSTTNWAPTGYLNAREIPVTLQLPDWNHWLPTVHPLDAFGDSFTASGVYNDYLTIRSLLRYEDPQAYLNAQVPLIYWGARATEFLVPLTESESDPAWNNQNYVAEIYSTGLWSMVKSWEVNQEFGLEGMSQTVFGPQAASRSWYSNMSFLASPNMLHIPRKVLGLGNGLSITHDYFSQMWYQLQVTLNDGNGSFSGTTPIDFPYVFNFVASLSANSPVSPAPGHAALELFWIIKGLQVANFDPGPEIGSGGWQYWISDPTSLLIYPNNTILWTELTDSQHGAMLKQYMAVWEPKLTSFTAQQMYQGGWASPTTVPDPTNPSGPYMGNKIAYVIPRLAYWGADPALINHLVAWAQTVWPKYNWHSILTTTCVMSPTRHLLCTPGT